MNIPPVVASDLRSVGIIFDSDMPESLCLNHGRPVCFIAEPGSSFIATGSIIGCELKIDSVMQMYTFMVEIDKREIMGMQLNYFRYEGNGEWVMTTNESTHMTKGRLIFPDLE